jgi:hypothetical protein
MGPPQLVAMLNHGRCPLLAQSGHAPCADECPLLGAKRTLLANLDL